MYSSRGSNSYAQQAYGVQSSFGQTPSSAYPGSSTSGVEGLSQISAGSRHPSLLVGAHDIDIGGGAHRPLPTAATHYGGQYSSLYSSAALGSGQQVPDYPSLERRQYIGRDLQPEAAGRLSDSVGFAHQQQSEIYDRLEQAVIREQILKNQSLQSASHDNVSRHAEYLTARSATLRHPTQELDSYGVRIESDPRAVSVVSRSSYGGQPASSILGAAPQRNVEDIVYTQSSSNPGYGVSLPPGRDYGAGKGLHLSPLDDYPSRKDDRKDERGGYSHDLDLREAERRRERLREREKDRERDRDREREREKERNRDREKDRERKRIIELRERERERDRERKRALEARRERTPPRVSKDRHSSLTRDSRLLLRDSPRHGALHRLHSPEKDKRRVYLCKVYSSSMVDPERDYISVDKRYPRLYICPDFSKLVVNWPQDSLKLSMRTAVSFEHDFVEEETGTVHKEPSAESLEHKPFHSMNKGTVWNAKIVLMSGLSRSATEELSSDRISDDRVPHICHLLRFAVLKHDRSFMAIGGQWDPIDGGNPADDESSLVRTALRHVKDVTQLDLQSCRHWNRFLEIHYDRIGEDGLFSHKEVTVLFVPDLSDCLPSLDAWREQWFAHKKAVAEREKLLALKKEKAREKKDGLKEKEINTAKDAKRSEKSEKDTAGAKSLPDASKGKNVDGSQKLGVGGQAGESSIKTPLKKEEPELADKGNDVSAPQDSAKPKKKKIVRRIVKKVADKKAGPQNDRKDNDVGSKKAVETKEVKPETAAAGPQNDRKDNDVGSKKAVETKEVKPETAAGPADVKTFTRKKVTKKESDGPSVLKEDKNEESVKDETQQELSDCKVELKPKEGGPVKKTVKRKIIKRVPKKKTIVGESTSEPKESKGGNSNEHGKIQVDEGKKEVDGTKSGNDLISSSQPVGSKERESNVTSAGIVETTDDKVLQKEDGDKTGSAAKLSAEVKKSKLSPKKNQENDTSKSKDKEKLSDGKEERSGKDEPRAKSSNDAERKKSEEPPRPGFILQTKNVKDARLRSKTLSLDTLLDYSDKDVEESNFELSLFAESFYEMLQYQMGSLIFTFLQKLRAKFVTERNQRKRKREERKHIDKLKSSKRLKSEEPPSEAATKSVEKDKSRLEEEKYEPKEENIPVGENNKVKMEVEDVVKQVEEEEEVEEEVEEVEEEEEVEDEEEEDEEDPEEDPQSDEEMKDESPKADSSKQNDDEMMVDAVTKPELADKDEKDTSAEERSFGKEADMKPDTAKEESKAKEKKTDAQPVTKAEKKSVVDRELLQAFRFFDRNLAGYIRVEDMRLLLHSLGKCLSNRDVKELAQSALLESNTGRDDRILYEKLVRMSFGDKE